MPFVLQAQGIEIRGTIRDAQGEKLPLANLIIFPDSVLASSDVTGSYSARVHSGLKTLRLSYTGYEPFVTSGEILGDTTLDFVLTPRIDLLQEIVIATDRFSRGDIVHSASSGTSILSKKDLHIMPSLFGGPDIIRALQLLPGTVRGMEGSSDTFVRGGAADQNLVLLDGAPIYNTGHLLGFMSIFNPEIIDHVEMINGGFPAEFGGRLSSVMNINTVSDIPDRTTISAEVGLISSRIKLEQPIIKDRASFWVTGRRTYVDELIKRVSTYELPYFFHEVDGKIILHPSSSHQIEIGHHGGEDNLDYLRDKEDNGDEMLTTFNSRTSSQTLKWRHSTPNLWRNELSMFRTAFETRTQNQYRNYLVSGYSKIEDYGAKFNLERDSLWGDASLSTGVEWIRHGLSPNVLNSEGSIADVLRSSATDGEMFHEFAAYIQQEWSVFPKLRINAGIRGSMASVDNAQYIFPEPRISARYALGRNAAFKLNYSRMVQYIHRISSSAMSSPIDVWYPVTGKIRPQTSHQYTAAVQRFLPDKKIFISLEGYYKSMHDLIAFEEGTNLLVKSDFDSRLIQGSGKAHGIEFLVRKDAGKFTGWVSYTLAWSWRRFDGLNDGDWFRARYDRRHNGAVVVQHLIGRRWAISGLWEYISGARFTPVIGQYVSMAPNETGMGITPLFADINSVKLSDSHRLDLGIKFFSKPGSKFEWTWFAGVYNAYNRATPIGIAIKTNKLDNSMKYSQPGLFGLLPFISYGCKF